MYANRDPCTVVLLIRRSLSLSLLFLRLCHGVLRSCCGGSRCGAERKNPSLSKETGTPLYLVFIFYEGYSNIIRDSV